MKQRNAPAANVASHAYVFNIGGLKPAQDPRELIHSGKGGAFDPHGLEWKNKSNSQINLTARSHNFLLREKKLMLNDGWHGDIFFIADWLVLICRTLCGTHIIKTLSFRFVLIVFQENAAVTGMKKLSSTVWRFPLMMDFGVLSRTSPSGGWLHYRSDPVLALAPGLHDTSVFTAPSCILYKMIMVKESHCLCRP